LKRLSDRAKFGSVETKEMKNINRRESPRIAIRLQCHVSSPALWVKSAMYTENISRSGVLVAWRGVGTELPVPALGQIITVEIELPANHGFGQKCIHCQGSVMRITNSVENFPLVALRVNYMDFRSFHDRIRAFEAVQPAVSSWMA
jgi:PilZ domain